MFALLIFIADIFNSKLGEKVSKFEYMRCICNKIDQIDFS